MCASTPEHLDTLVGGNLTSCRRGPGRRNRAKRGAAVGLAVAAALRVGSILSSTALAATGQWITDGGGNWSNTANWNAGVVPNAIDDVADFNSLNITLNSTVTLDV